MSSTQNGQRVAGARVDALPLRSLTAVWVVLGVFSLVLVGVVGRSLWAKSKARAAASVATQPQGPTKRQVRERQEHIALTERALELARKEQKAAAASAPSPSSAAAPTPAARAASTDAAAAPAAKAAGSSSSATSAASAAPPKTPAASDQPVAPKPAASGLDAMRADIAAQFE